MKSLKLFAAVLAICAAAACNNGQKGFEKEYQAFTDTLSQDYKVLFSSPEFNKVVFCAHNEYRDQATPVYLLDLESKQQSIFIPDDYFTPGGGIEGEAVFMSIDSCKAVGSRLYIAGNREACGSGAMVEHPVVFLDLSSGSLEGVGECMEYEFIDGDKIRMTKARITNLDTAEYESEYDYETWDEEVDM